MDSHHNGKQNYWKRCSEKLSHSHFVKRIFRRRKLRCGRSLDFLKFLLLYLRKIYSYSPSTDHLVTEWMCTRRFSWNFLWETPGSHRESSRRLIWFLLWGSGPLLGTKKCSVEFRSWVDRVGCRKQMWHHFALWLGTSGALSRKTASSVRGVNGEGLGIVQTESDRCPITNLSEMFRGVK